MKKIFILCLIVAFIFSGCTSPQLEPPKEDASIEKSVIDSIADDKISESVSENLEIKGLDELSQIENIDIDDAQNYGDAPISNTETDIEPEIEEETVDATSGATSKANTGGGNNGNSGYGNDIIIEEAPDRITIRDEEGTFVMEEIIIDMNYNTKDVEIENFYNSIIGVWAEYEFNSLIEFKQDGKVMLGFILSEIIGQGTVDILSYDSNTKTCTMVLNLDSGPINCFIRKINNNEIIIETNEDATTYHFVAKTLDEANDVFLSMY